MRERRLWRSHCELYGSINDMKILFLIVAIVAAIPALAGEWALVNSSGTVVRVIVADGAAILDRDDGPWVKTKGQKVGVGWNYDGSKFAAPGSTFTVIVSSGSSYSVAPSTGSNKSRPRKKP